VAEVAIVAVILEDVALMVVDREAWIPRQCRHCERNNHISEKCWEKSNRPEWTYLIDTMTTTPDDTTHAPSATPSSSGSLTVVLSQTEYNKLRQLEFSQNNHSATHATSSGMNAYIASSSRSWILDSGVSSHMASIQNK